MITEKKRYSVYSDWYCEGTTDDLEEAKDLLREVIRRESFHTYDCPMIILYDEVEKKRVSLN